MIKAHIDQRADITLAAQPASADDAPGMGILRFDRAGQIVAFEEKPKPPRLEEIGRSIPGDATFAKHVPDRPFVASMGIYVFSRKVLLDLMAEDGATDFGREVIPHALGRCRVNAFLFHGYWADVGTVDSFYDANIMLTRPGASFSFYDPRKPMYTHPRFLPAARLSDCTVRDAIAEGCSLERTTIESSIIGIRTNIRSGSTISRSVLLGADFYDPDNEADTRLDRPPLGIGRQVVLDRVIVDKNARIGDRCQLVNLGGIEHADGNGYYIRNRVIIVAKDSIIEPGTVI